MDRGNAKQIVHWLVGAFWDDDQSERFLNEGIWMNGYEDKFLETVNEILPGDRIAMKSSFVMDRKYPALRVKAIGTVTKNHRDGRKLAVAWDKNFTPFDIRGISKRATIHKITDPEEISRIFMKGNAMPIANPTIETPTAMPLNLILYGPPGTGKTHALLQKYAGKFTEKKKKTLEEYALEFAAELSWWEIVAIVMLEKKTAKVDHILDHPLLKAKHKQSTNKNPRASVWGVLQNHAKADCQYVLYKRRLEPLLFSKDEKSVWSIDETIAQNEVPELVEKLRVYQSYQPHEDDIKRYEFVTFHQSFGYEDFVEGIKPVIDDESREELAYEVKPGIFWQIAERAKNDPDNRYAIFIDEINRGNVACIFGELITLIEEDKRENVMLTLPYSRESFTVPKNLHIIGTMNTADRSVEALDSALRRRFTFEPCLPDHELLRQCQPKSLKVNLADMLQTINERIEALLDRDHRIGHSYFMGLQKQENPLQGLRVIFANKIKPLLEEYFYGNTAKIGMVLGEAFVRRRTNGVSFATGDWEQEEEELMLYDLVDPLQLDIEDFESIYA